MTHGHEYNTRTHGGISELPIVRPIILTLIVILHLTSQGKYNVKTLKN